MTNKENKMPQYVLQTKAILKTETCCSCGIIFAFPDYMMDRLSNIGGSFYCPNGHQQYYAKTEVARLREKLDEQIRHSTLLSERAFAAKNREKKVQAEINRLKKRTSAGVCPCCNRTFQQLARHMKSKHPEVY
jgi:hypothetical protein